MTRLVEFLAKPSGRAICDVIGRKSIEFCGMSDAEAAKRILLCALHLRPLVVEFEASTAGFSPIPPAKLLPAISAGCAYQVPGETPRSDDLGNRTWTLDGDVIRQGSDVIAVVMGDAPPELADLVATAPQVCSAAMAILQSYDAKPIS